MYSTMFGRRLPGYTIFRPGPLSGGKHTHGVRPCFAAKSCHTERGNAWLSTLARTHVSSVLNAALTCRGSSKVWIHSSNRRMRGLLVKHVMISSNHHRNFTFPRYQSIRWKHKTRCSVVEVLKLSRHSSKCRGSTNASTRGAVTNSHHCGAGLYTPPGSTSTTYRFHRRFQTWNNRTVGNAA